MGGEFVVIVEVEEADGNLHGTGGEREQGAGHKEKESERGRDRGCLNTEE